VIIFNVIDHIVIYLFVIDYICNVIAPCLINSYLGNLALV